MTVVPGVVPGCVLLIFQAISLHFSRSRLCNARLRLLDFPGDFYAFLPLASE